MDAEEPVASRTRSGSRLEMTEVGDLLSFEQLELAPGDEVPRVVPGSIDDILSQIEDSINEQLTVEEPSALELLPVVVDSGGTLMENDEDKVVLNYDDSSAEEDVDMDRPEEVQEKSDIVGVLAHKSYFLQLVERRELLSFPVG